MVVAVVVAVVVVVVVIVVVGRGVGRGRGRGCGRDVLNPISAVKAGHFERISIRSTHGQQTVNKRLTNG